MSRIWRHSGTAGFAHPVEALFPLLVLGTLAYLLIDASNRGRIVIVAVCVVAVLSSSWLHRLCALRVGDAVEVKQRGKHIGRRGTVTEIGVTGLFFTVRLFATADGDRILPSANVEFSRSALKKLFWQRWIPEAAGGRRSASVGVLRSALSYYGWCWRHYAPWPWHERHGRVSVFGGWLFAIGHLLCILGLVLYVGARRELRWPSVTGQVTARHVASSECPRFRPENILLFPRIWREVWPEHGERRCIEMTISYRYPTPGAEQVGSLRKTREEGVGSDEGDERLSRYLEGDPIEVRYNPRDHAQSTVAPAVEHLRASGASLLKWGSLCVLFSMFGAGLPRRVEEG